MLFGFSLVGSSIIGAVISTDKEVVGTDELGTANELSNCSLVTYSELQPIVVLLSALGDPFVGTARGHLQLVASDCNSAH